MTEGPGEPPASLPPLPEEPSPPTPPTPPTPSTPPPPSEPPPVAPPPPATNPNALPPMAPTSGMSGCAKAALVGGAILVVLILAGAAFFFWGVRRFIGQVEEVAAPDSCEFISDEEAGDVMGVTVTVESGESAIGSILGIIRDTRLLGAAPSCFISSADGSTAAWISVYDGGDAQAVFANASDVADGQVVSSTSIEGGSVQLETSPFRGPDVPGLGDEAFCTEVGMVVSGGVLAREGNRVVYVSMMPGSNDDPLGRGVCDRAIPLARELLARS